MCGNCGAWLTVELRAHSVTTGNVKVSWDSAPYLKCKSCGHAEPTRFVDSKSRGAAMEARRLGQGAVALKLEDRRFGLCVDAKFQYSSLDWEAIPAVRQSDLEPEGYYVPVFFEAKVLAKYMMHEEYPMNYFDAGGRIRFSNGFSLEYGINRNGKVLCWLGDLDKIPEKERYYLRSENIPSDHDVVSGLYLQSRLDFPAGKTREQELTKATRELVAVSRKTLGRDLHMHSRETIKISQSLARPVIWDRTLMLPINDLFKVCVESFEIKFLRKNAISMGAMFKSNAPLYAILQKWLELRFKMDAEEISAPLRVLNTWRNALDHKWSEQSSRRLEECYELMGLRGDARTFENLYVRMVEGLIRSFRCITGTIAMASPAPGSNGVSAAAQDGPGHNPA